MRTTTIDRCMRLTSLARCQCFSPTLLSRWADSYKGWAFQRSIKDNVVSLSVSEQGIKEIPFRLI